MSHHAVLCRLLPKGALLTPPSLPRLVVPLESTSDTLRVSETLRVSPNLRITQSNCMMEVIPSNETRA